MSKMRYVPHIPKTVPDGMILVHNFVKPQTDDQKPGWMGFRCWLQVADDGVLPCRCGWAPHLTHYKPQIA